MCLADYLPYMRKDNGNPQNKTIIDNLSYRNQLQ